MDENKIPKIEFELAKATKSGAFVFVRDTDAGPVIKSIHSGRYFQKQVVDAAVNPSDKFVRVREVFPSLRVEFAAYPGESMLRATDELRRSGY